MINQLSFIIAPLLTQTERLTKINGCFRVIKDPKLYLLLKSIETAEKRHKTSRLVYNLTNLRPQGSNSAETILMPFSGRRDINV